MQTFSDKVKEDICEAQNGICAGCFRPIESVHHQVKNTKPNNKKYPLLVHSIFSAKGLCNHCHQHFSHQYKISDKLAQLYEEALNAKV